MASIEVLSKRKKVKRQKIKDKRQKTKDKRQNIKDKRPNIEVERRQWHTLKSWVKVQKSKDKR